MTGETLHWSTYIEWLLACSIVQRRISTIKLHACSHKPQPVAGWDVCPFYRLFYNGWLRALHVAGNSGRWRWVFSQWSRPSLMNTPGPHTSMFHSYMTNLVSQQAPDWTLAHWRAMFNNIWRQAYITELAWKCIKLDGVSIMPHKPVSPFPTLITLENATLAVAHAGSQWFTALTDEAYLTDLKNIAEFRQILHVQLHHSTHYIYLIIKSVKVWVQWRSQLCLDFQITTTLTTTIMQSLAPSHTTSRKQWHGLKFHPVYGEFLTPDDTFKLRSKGSA